MKLDIPFELGEKVTAIKREGYPDNCVWVIGEAPDASIQHFVVNGKYLGKSGINAQLWVFGVGNVAIWPIEQLFHTRREALIECKKRNEALYEEWLKEDS